MLGWHENWGGRFTVLLNIFKSFHFLSDIHIAPYFLILSIPHLLPLSASSFLYHWILIMYTADRLLMHTEKKRGHKVFRNDGKQSISQSIDYFTRTAIHHLFLHSFVVCNFRQRNIGMSELPNVTFVCGSVRISVHYSRTVNEYLAVVKVKSETEREINMWCRKQQE